jgi:hypothetical protein
MELIESYINEVGRFLPLEQRDEILLELRDAILGEVEGEALQSAQGGGEISLEVQQVVLERFGHPLKVAARYQPKKYLIGPDLYPAFVQTLKVVVAIALFAQVVLALVVGFTSGWQVGPWLVLDTMVDSLVWIVAIVIGVFLAIEYSGERLNWYENWRAKTLPSGSLGVIKRGDVITNLITEGLFLLLWNGVIVIEHWVPSGLDLGMTDVWQSYFVYLNIVVGLAFVLHFYVLIRGIWQTKALLFEVVTNVALLGILAGLISSGDLLTFADGFSAEARLHIERVLRVALFVVAGFCAWDIWLALRTFRGTLGRLSDAAGS